MDARGGGLSLPVEVTEPANKHLACGGREAGRKSPAGWRRVTARQHRNASRHSLRGPSKLCEFF